MCLIALTILIAVCLCLLFQQYCFGQSGERLTKRLRLLTFQNLLRQDVAYFDDPHHATGALTARLAGDAAMVRTVSESCRADCIFGH